MLINTLMSKAHTFMTLTITMITISITTHKNIRVMKNTPVTIMKGAYTNLLYKIMKTIEENMKRRMKASYAKKMRPIQSLMMVSNNDMRINLSRFT